MHAIVTLSSYSAVAFYNGVAFRYEHPSYPYMAIMSSQLIL